MDSYEKCKIHTKRYKKIKKLLEIVYGYDSFKPKQYEIINKIISGDDVCAILPTGYGKSLTFQIPAIYLDKPAIVVSPLISLMDDQRIILEKLGITSCCYNNKVTNKYELKKSIMEFEYQFIYITPESAVKLGDFFKQLNEHQGISLIAIDEAHCISSYGLNFRPDYRGLTFFREILPEVPILAVTATATTVVGNDICKVLGFGTSKPIKTSFDRPNLFLEVRKKRNKYTNKTPSIDSDIVPIIKKHPGESIIIYCVTRKLTEQISQILKVYGVKCGIYHAGLSDEKKTKSHHDFIEGKIKVMAATIAFGMGINKSDVRVVIHYGCPKNLEGYYQEIGRAGRDGKNAYCYTFYSAQDFIIQENHIRKNKTSDAVLKFEMRLLEKMKKYVVTTDCRRKLLLDYFDEEFPDKCNFCDNCCGVKKSDCEKITTTSQDIKKEAKILINLIESIKTRSFGIGMYINILRGSSAKSITSAMRKNDYYGKGKHKSVAWWKEMSEILINRGLLSLVAVQGRFGMQVVKVTKDGLTWANFSDLGNIIKQVDTVKLEPVEMVTTI